jgi:hypothetical protein
VTILVDTLLEEVLFDVGIGGRRVDGKVLRIGHGFSNRGP